MGMRRMEGCKSRLRSRGGRSPMCNGEAGRESGRLRLGNERTFEKVKGWSRRRSRAWETSFGVQWPW